MKVRLVLLACGSASLLFTGQVWLDYAYAGVPVSWPLAAAISAARWSLWAPLAFAIERLAARWPIGRRSWAAGAAVHLPASLALAAVKVSVDRAIAARLIGVRRVPSSFLELYVALMTYWAIVGIAAALRQARRRRERELRAAQLEGELARARLDALKMRLHPHFLFNALNSISGLMRDDVEAADLMLSRLADLLRATLDRAEAQEVPLAEELDLTRLYLSIQEARFGSRLSAAVDAEPATLAVLVPSLALQPLVENAFEHGVARETGPIRVAVRARLDGDRLVIEVEDDGAGPPPEAREGLGLATTRARLERLHGAAAGLSLIGAPGGGSIARMTLPSRGAPEA